jgi:hypothetical protein
LPKAARRVFNDRIHRRDAETQSQIQEKRIGRTRVDAEEAEGAETEEAFPRYRRLRSRFDGSENFIGFTAAPAGCRGRSRKSALVVLGVDADGAETEGAFRW